MMTTLNSSRGFCRMTMPTIAAKSAPSPSPEQLLLCRGIFATRALAWAAMVIGILCVSTLQAQVTPLPVIVADFNHDGIPDVLTLSNTSPTATIAFGAVPYGTFSAGAKAVTFPAACTSLGAGSMLAGDFNGDGFPDLAFFCARRTAGVMLGNGDGTFGAPKLLSGIVTSIAVLGDFNHDGKLDIAVVGLNGLDSVFRSIGFYPGNGDGTFGSPIFSEYDQTVTYVAVASADINGDGYPEIVAENFAANATPSIDVFGNNKDGTFGVLNQQIAAPTTSVSIAGATSSSSLLFGNFFGKNAADLVVSTFGASAGLSAFQNTSTATTYSFNDPVTIPVAGLTGVQAGGFAGSGFTDVAVSNGTSIAVLANDGAANFAASYSTLTVASASAFFAVADANGDGYADIFTATSTAGALQLGVNVTSGSATATSQPFSLGIGTKAVSATWNGNVNLLASTATGQQIVVGAVSSTTAASSKNPSLVGDAVTISASVVPAILGRVPTGNVIFSDGTTPLATMVLDETGNASYMTRTLTQGTHLIRVAYAGDTYFAPSVSAVLSQVVNHAPAVAPNLSWTPPAAIVYGTALSGAQLNATAVDSTGVAIPGTFAYTPVAGTVLDAGTKVLSVTFTPTDLLSFLPATTTVPLAVTQAAPVLTWATPPSIAYGVPLSATQLNASVAGVTAAALPGTYTYNPASGSVLAPGTQTLSVNFVPANALDYTTATGSVKIVVTGVTVASFTPNTANLGDPATKITLTGAGFVATSVVQVNGAAIATTLVSPTTLTATVPASYFTKPGTLQIAVADPSVSLVSPALSLTVLTPNVGATVTAPPTTPPGSQPAVTVTLTQPYPVPLVGTLTIGFARAGTPQLIDPSLQFAAGGTTFTFPIPANTTTVPAVQLQAGTIAGTITVPLTLTAGGVDVTPAGLAPVTIVVPPAAPSVSGMTVTRSGDQLTVVMHGFSNTREVVNAKFHFTPAAGATLGTPDLTLPADTIFNADWFDTDPSAAYGSTFTYTQIFNTSDGAANIGSVDATLTNTVGASTSVTAK